jgi:hypothetical protein
MLQLPMNSVSKTATLEERRTFECMLALSNQFNTPSSEDSRSLHIVASWSLSLAFRILFLTNLA